MSGIRSMADLHKRCRREGDCLIWTGCTSSTSRGNVARVWLPKIGATSITRALHLFQGLPRPTPAALLVPTCGRWLCANPSHRVMGTKGLFLVGRRHVPGPKVVAAGVSNIFEWRP